MHDSLHSSDSKTDHFPYLKYGGGGREEAYGSEMRTKPVKGTMRQSQDPELTERKPTEEAYPEVLNSHKVGRASGMWT